MKRLCERMGLEGAQASAFAVAGYIHDIGKAGAYHLTALNVAEYDGHRAAAQKVGTAPERYFHLVSLHHESKLAVVAMYERFDGKGFPSGARAKEISLGARMLAVVDSYADLTSNPRNPARRVLKPEEAVQFLSKFRGTIFDPAMVDLLGAEVAGNDVRAKLLADRHSVLLVDPDPEETMVLELRMLEAGFDVRIARTAQQAEYELGQRDFELVVTEVDLDLPDSGLALRSAAASAPWAKNVLAWVVHTRKTDRQLAEIVFDLGVDDMVSKPTPPDVFVAKMRQLIDRKQRALGGGAAAKGVSGSLTEMGLPELVQVLWHGRKSCAVRLKTTRGAGEISFADGQIVDAKFAGKRGEEAFYGMLVLKDGEFQIDNTATTTERTIQVSPEGLLLEGMRRIDEGLVA
jgi:response regulator RpfG family c-di-GMP phosphodiesterase